MRRGLSILRSCSLLLAALLVALACGASVSRAAAHGPTPRLVVPGPGLVRAGDRVELRWEGGAPDMEEMEILLTVDGIGGRTVQVSPELDPHRGVFVWKVPELGRVQARLSIRFNREGHEIESEPSAVIDILSAREDGMPVGMVPDGRAPGVPMDRGAAAEQRTVAAEPASRIGERMRAMDASPARQTPQFVRTAALPTAHDNTVPAFVPARN